MKVYTLFMRWDGKVIASLSQEWKGLPTRPSVNPLEGDVDLPERAAGFTPRDVLLSLLGPAIAIAPLAVRGALFVMQPG